jgi:alginate O-acetyltransferase complex protein AlgJ
MVEFAAGYLPDRPRPKWFSVALVTLFVTAIGIGLAGVFQAPRNAPTQFENRKTEVLPALPRTWTALREYPAHFETWFDDRFGLRGPLVHLDHWARAVLFGVSPVPKVLIGKSGWLYFRGEDAKAFDRWYRGSEAISDATLAAIRAELLQRQAFLASRGIPFVVVVVPEKYSIYPEYLPDWATPRARQTPFDRLVTALAADTLLHFVDLRAPLRAAKGPDRLYYQTDSHWNYLGASVGYGVLMTAVAKLLPGLAIATVPRPPYVAGVDYYSGDLAQMLGLPAQFREDDIAPLGKILATPESRCARLDAAASSPGVETFVYRCPNSPRFIALIYRDSMGIPLQPMLAENFSRSTFVTSAQLDAGLVDRLRPDIVIEEMVERALTGIPFYALRLPAR